MVRTVPKPNPAIELHNLVAVARFNINEEDVYAYFTHVLVDPTWRRKGIATTIYNFVADQYDIDVRPSETLSYDGQLFWQARSC
jgi:GNAT superfamily N-acetyltransferase